VEMDLWHATDDTVGGREDEAMQRHVSILPRALIADQRAVSAFPTCAEAVADHMRMASKILRFAAAPYYIPVWPICV
jgi:hypothetical protein